MTPRFGQLAYTSFDAPGTAGGWQVKQATGDLTAAEAHALVEGVRTVLTPVEPMPTYPTLEDCERGPRRLAYRRLDAQCAGYWHTVPAGPDSTGRPGNVFAHAVLDREPAALAPWRPIQRWRSPHWLRPYGPAAVAGAALPEDAPMPADAVTRETVLTFVMDTATWRLGTLFGLLDAVLAALGGGPPVVLGVESGETAAQWIGLVSFLMSPGTASRLNFSTFDRADQLALALRGGQHLTAVPVADLGAVPTDVVVIDETATLSMGELGGDPHRTAAGHAIEVTAWSAMAQVTMLDHHSARLVLDDVEHYAALTQDDGLHPAWPMAMSVVDREDFADALAEAHTVIAAHSPLAVAPDSAVGHTVAGVLAALVGSTTADAWRAVEQSAPGKSADHADLTYLVRAVTDPGWLDQDGLIPVGPRSLRGLVVPAELTAAIGPALTQAGTAGPERVLRLVDLLWRAGVGDDRLYPAVTAAEVTGALADPHAGPALAHRLAWRIGVDTRLAAASAALRVGAPSADGVTPVDVTVLEWFADGIGVPIPSALATATPWDATWTRAALRGARARVLGPAQEGDPFAELWWLRLCGSPEFDRLAAAAVWPPSELLIAAGTGALAAAAVLPTLLGAPNSEALDQLSDAVLAAGAESTAVACAAARRIDPRVWIRQGYLQERQGDYTALWDEAIAQVGLGRLHQDLGVRLLTLALLAAAHGMASLAHGDALAADPATADAATEQLLALVEQDALAATAVLAASLLPTTREDTDASERTPVQGLVTRVAVRLVTAREFTDEDAETVAVTLARLAEPDAADPPMRRYRKMVHKLLTQRLEAQPSLAARIRGSH